MLKWILIALLVLAGLFLIFAMTGHSTLGLVLLGSALVIFCYTLLGWLSDSNREPARLLRTALTSLLCLGVLAAGVTEFFILRASRGQPDRVCPYMIVLGAKVNGTRPSLSLNNRIDAAYDYLTEHPHVIAVLSGGQGPDEGISEAQCMFDQLTQRGIDPQRLLLEDKSTSTWENLTFSLDILEETTGHRPEAVGLLSSEYHLFRASLQARDCGTEAVGIPAATSWLSLRLNYFLREIAGVWHYIILGGYSHA